MAQRLAMSVEQLQALLDINPSLSDSPGGVLGEEPQIGSLPPEVSFAKFDVQPPSAAYLGLNDTIRLSVFSSVASLTVTAAGRFLNVDGHIIPFQFSVIPTADRAATNLDFSLGEGFLLNVFVISSNIIIQRGSTYIVLMLLRGGASFTTLTRGYLSSRVPLGWPGIDTEPSVSGQGFLRIIAGTNPAAGVEVSETVPTNARWRLVAFLATLVTDATAATRTAQLLIDDGVTTFLLILPTTTQIASLTRQYNGKAVGLDPQPIGTQLTWGLPPDIYIPAGGRIRTSTINLQAGDNWTAPQYMVEEWLAP